MLDFVDEKLHSAVDRWLADFEGALATGDAALLGALFHRDGYWRDVLAFTWHMVTIQGDTAIGAAIGKAIGGASSASGANARGFRVDLNRTPPRRVTRAGVEVIEAIFAFETAVGVCDGVLRLTPDRDGVTLKAWTLMTALEALKGHEEALDRARPRGESYSRDFRGPNWQDLRDQALAYTTHDPAVVVVGGGQAGLAIAARLGQLGVDALIVDRHPRVGDNWRTRYHALTLHNQVQVNHLPYMPFPPNWPTYIPKDKLAGWFEAYVAAMELNYWTGAEFKGGAYDDTAGCWTVEIKRDGETRTLRPRHLVMATGVSGIPHVPEISGLEKFSGPVVHSSRYTDGEDWSGKRAIVIGTGNSGHDIAQDLCSASADVTLVQRSPTLVVNIEPSAQLPYTLYEEGPPLEDCDLIVTGIPHAVSRQSHIQFTAKAKQLDRDLLDGLEARGFRLDFGDDGSGWQFKYLTRGGGYYFNVGASDMIVDGKIRVIQFGGIADFNAGGVVLDDGTALASDLIVLATGWKPQEELVARLFGAEVAARVGPLWGFDALDGGEELRNMYMRTGQPGLWFIAGSLAQCRINSKYLGLQIKACEEGLISLAAPAT